MNKDLALVLARGFIIFAGAFWLTLAITSGIWYFIFFTLVFPISIFALTYTAPRYASWLLLLGAFLPAVYGLMINWEIGVWGIMSSFFLFPTLASSWFLWKVK